MKATTQYNDLIGTAAADITDQTINDLGKYLAPFGVDDKKYKIIGLRYYNGFKLDDNSISLTVIVEDLMNDRKLVKMEISIPAIDLLHCFKRLNIVLFERYYDHANIENIDTIPNV